MFDGIFTPIVTPFTVNEEIDYKKMYHNLSKWSVTNLSGIVVLGSNGEFAYMAQDEKVSLVKNVINHFSKDKKIIVGTGCESTKETIELCKKVGDLGANAVLILPPHYYKGAMKDDILYGYYVEIANESPVPVFIYNMPGNTGINLSSSLVAKLSKHANITGIKDTSGNIIQISELVRDTDESFSVFAGNAGYLLPALSVGAQGATLALANIFPDECCHLFSLFKEGRLDDARKLQLKMLEINSIVTAKLGIPALKFALDILGYQGGEPRRPLRPLSKEARMVVKDALEQFL